MCVNGARWVQEKVLARYSEDKLKVYTVWLPMIPGDGRDKWKDTLLPDERVQHYWDGKRDIGKWFTDHVGQCSNLGAVAWDAFYLFDGSAKWDDELKSCLSCGTPVIKDTEKLAKALKDLLES